MLSQSERDILADQIFKCARYFGKYDLSATQITQTIDILESFFNKNLNEYLSAYISIMNDKKIKSFPSPSQLREYLTPELDEDTKAVEIASRIVSAVTQFGWPNPDQAKAYIGDLGWEAVKRFGSWGFVCENLGVTLNVTTFQAQIREISKGISKTVKLGCFDQPIGIESPDQKVLDLVKIKTLKEPGK